MGIESGFLSAQSDSAPEGARRGETIVTTDAATVNRF
jgi:hypothetical protein